MSDHYRPYKNKLPLILVKDYETGKTITICSSPLALRKCIQELIENERLPEIPEDEQQVKSMEPKDIVVKFPQLELEFINQNILVQ